MGLCVPIYLVNPQFAVNRGYVTGVAVIDPNALNVHWEGQNIVYDFDDLVIVIALTDGFYGWNSNKYTVDHWTDIDNCRAISSSGDLPFGLFHNLLYVADSGIIMPTFKVNLPEGTPRRLSLPAAPSNYWYPYSS